MNDNSDIFEILGNVLKEAGTTVTNAGDKVEDIGKDVQKAKSILNYWSPSNADNRKETERRVNALRAAESWLIDQYKKFWLCLIITAIITHVLFNKIVLWCGIQNNLQEILIICGVHFVVNLIIGIILFATT